MKRLKWKRKKVGQHCWCSDYITAYYLSRYYFKRFFNWLKNEFITNDIHLFIFIIFTGPKKFSYKGHNYFYSGQVPELATKRVDWLEARNICREYCMDAVSIETQEENNLVYKLIQENDVPYIWTSGRLCDFNGNNLHL